MTRSTGVTWALAVAFVVSLVVIVVQATTGGSDSGHREPVTSAQVLLDAEKDADTAARKAAVSLTTYDYTSLDADFGWAADGGTAKFQAQYAEVSAPIRKLVLKIKAHAVGTVVDAAAHATDADHVTVLLFVDQVITNKTSDERKLDQPRMSLAMVRQDGRWLVDQVTINNLTDS